MTSSHGLEEELELALAAATADPANAYGLVIVAERLRAAGSSAEAGTIAKRAVELNPSDVRVLTRAANLLHAIGDYESASELLQILVGLDPKDIEARFQLAFGFLVQREYRRALDQLDVYVKLAPEAAMGWRNHAGALEALGEFHRALASSNRGVLLEANNAEFRLHRAGLLNHLGRTADALADIRIAESLEGLTTRVAWFYSVIYDFSGDLDLAIDFARKSSFLDPGSLDLRRYLEDLEKRRSIVVDREDLPEIARAEERRSHHPGSARRTVVQTGWMDALASQGRIILALLMRDAKTRFGETRLGYLWAFLEPMSHLALIASVFAATHLGGSPPIGTNMIVYYFTGVLPYLLFANTVFGVQQSLNANRSVLQVPLVQHVDILLARGLLELITQFSVAIIVLTVFVMLGLPAIPYDVLDAACGLFFIWLVGFGVGVTNATIMHFVKSWDYVFANIVRALYFTSGIFLSPLEMPEWVRDILVWNPVLQAIDWVRSGFFETWHPIWLNRPYVVFWGLAALLLGLSLERACRRRLTVA